MDVSKCTLFYYVISKNYHFVLLTMMEPTHLRTDIYLTPTKTNKWNSGIWIFSGMWNKGKVHLTHVTTLNNSVGPLRKNICTLFVCPEQPARWMVSIVLIFCHRFCTFSITLVCLSWKAVCAMPEHLFIILLVVTESLDNNSLGPLAENYFFPAYTVCPPPPENNNSLGPLAEN